MSGTRLPEEARGSTRRLGVPGGLREIVPGVLGATTDRGTDVLVVERPGAPNPAERRAAARVASRPSISDALTLAVARRWADPAGAAMPPLLLTAVRSMAWLLAVLLLIALAAGSPLGLGPILAVAGALALIAAGVVLIGRLGVAGAALDEAVRIVDGPILDVAHAAVAGDAAALARLQDLRAAWWTGPLDADPDDEEEVASEDAERVLAERAARDAAARDAATRDADAAGSQEPWRVRAADAVGLWGVNQGGDAVYGPGVLGLRDRAGRETLVVAPPDGVRGWRRFVVLQMTGATRRLETDDRSSLWWAVAPTEGRGARTGFVIGSALGALVTIGVVYAVLEVVNSDRVAWGLGVAIVFTVISGGAAWWAVDRIVRRACRQVVEPSPELRRRAHALRASFDDEGPDGTGVVSGRRLLWDALARPGLTAPRRRD